MTEKNKPSTMKSQPVKSVKKAVKKDPNNSPDLNCMQKGLSRRAFLSKSASLAAMGALAGSGILSPKAWADMIGDPADAKNRFTQMGSFVGYTPSQGPTATQLEFGTELFSDTIYSEPVVSQNAPFMHGMIEGPSNRARIQSVFTDDNATESDFLDKGYSLGRGELVQLEQDGSTWSLVHYYHPRGARTDGAKTDGLLKKVIKSSFDGTPTKMLCVTAANSNKFEKSGFTIKTIDGHTAHMIYVELDGGKTDGHLITGTSTNSLRPPYYISDATADPITWKIEKASTFHINTGYSLVELYTNSGLKSDGSYNPAHAHSHLVFYYSSNIRIFAIKGYFEENGDIPYPIMAAQTTVPYPSNKNVRVAHIEWSAGTNSHGLKPPSKVVFCGTTTVTEDSKTYENYISYLFTVNKCSINSFNAGGNFFVTLNTYHDSNLHTYTTSQRSIEDSNVSIDYHMLRNTHDLFSYNASNGDTFYVKLGNIQGLGLVAFILNVGSNGYVYLVAHYVLALPDTTAGLGEILNFVGGVSKFGGFRFYSIDENGSLFMNRQQRLATDDTPYGAPIFGLFDSTGALADFESGAEIQVPPDTDEGSELFNIDTTYLPGTGVGTTTLRHNLLLNTLLAFSTDISNTCQGVCLGAGAFKAVYAPKRFSLDSEHIVVKDIDEAGTTQGAFNVYSTLLERSWYSQQITTQKAYSTEVTQDSGDFYHLTISPADDDGNLAHLSATANLFLAIEVRADAPCQVTDVGSNLYHHIDRYNSFMAAVDSNSGKASLVVKATQFGQNIYARLVDTSTLAGSSNDPGLVTQPAPGVSKQYPWQMVNIAEQAQYRMSNTDATAIESYDEDPAFLDTAVYVTGDKVSDTQTTDDGTTVWESKGDYKASGSDMDNLASFCNQSGANLITVSNEQLASLYGTDSDPIDPLHNTTSLADSAVSQSSSTYFDYKNGVITHDAASISASAGSVGSIWGSVSHAVSDAFHHLQHLAEKDYKKIDKGVTIEINAAESTMVTISKDIMKGVNGVEQDLTEVVDTVEQYASVVVEVLKTVIKNSFMYKFIEMIIMLISLFQHLGDIKDLADNLKTTFFNALKSPPQSKQIASIGEEINKYIGAEGENTLTSLFNSSTKLAGKFGTKVPSNVLSKVVNNPFSNKLMGMAFSKAAKASNALDILEFDFSFPATMDPLFTDILNVK